MLKKMKWLLITNGILSLSLAAVVPEDSQAVITNFDNTNDGTGNYRFSFDTSNGIHREEIGYLVNIGQANEHIVVEGSYSYTDPDGNLITTQYIADENGYRVIKAPPTSIDDNGYRIIETPPSSFAIPANVVATLLGK